MIGILLGLISPFSKYKWYVIAGIWLSSLLYLNHFKNNQCEVNNIKSVVIATQKQNDNSDKADIKLHIAQNKNKQESEIGVKNVIEYREKIKTIKSGCPIDPIISDELIGLYDNTRNN